MEEDEDGGAMEDDVNDPLWCPESEGESEEEEEEDEEPTGCFERYIFLLIRIK